MPPAAPLPTGGPRRRYRTGVRKKRARADQPALLSPEVRAELGLADALSGELGKTEGARAFAERQEARPLVTLAQCMRGPMSAVEDLTIPAYDPSRTERVGPMPPALFVRLIEGMPRLDDGRLWRLRQRALLLARGLAAQPSSAGFRVMLYVRGAEPPAKPIVVRPPRLVLFGLRGCELYFILHLAPRGKGANCLPTAEALEQDMLRVARYQMQHKKVRLPIPTWSPSARHVHSCLSFGRACACARVRAFALVD